MATVSLQMGAPSSSSVFLFFNHSQMSPSLKWLITSGNLHRKDVIRFHLEVMMKMNSLAMAMIRMIGTVFENHCLCASGNQSLLADMEFVTSGTCVKCSLAGVKFSRINKKNYQFGRICQIQVSVSTK